MNYGWKDNIPIDRSRTAVVNEILLVTPDDVGLGATFYTDGTYATHFDRYGSAPDSRYGYKVEDGRLYLRYLDPPSNWLLSHSSFERLFIQQLRKKAEQELLEAAAVDQTDPTSV